MAKMLTIQTDLSFRNNLNLLGDQLISSSDILDMIEKDLIDKIPSFDLDSTIIDSCFTEDQNQQVKNSLEKEKLVLVNRIIDVLKMENEIIELFISVIDEISDNLKTPPIESAESEHLIRSNDSSKIEDKEEDLSSQTNTTKSHGIPDVDDEQEAIAAGHEFSLKDSNRVQSDQNNQKFSSRNTLLNVLDYFEQFLSTFSQQLTTSGDTNSDIKKDTENYIDVCKAYRTIIEIYGLGYKIPCSLDETNLAIKNALTILTEYEKSENAKNLQTVETLNDLIHLFPARILALCTKNLNNDAFYNEIKENVNKDIKLSQLKEIIPSTSKTIEDTLKDFKNEDKNGLSNLTTLNDNLLQLLLYHLFHGVLTENNGVISEFIDKKSVLFLVTTMIKTENYLSILQNNQKTTEKAIVTHNDSNALPNPNETIVATTGTQNDETLHENTLKSTSTGNQSCNDSTINQKHSVVSADVDEAVDSQKKVATGHDNIVSSDFFKEEDSQNITFLSTLNTLLNILDYYELFLSTFFDQLITLGDTNSDIKKDIKNYIDICNAYRTIIDKRGIEYKVASSKNENNLAIKDALTILTEYEKSEKLKDIQDIKRIYDLIYRFPEKIIASSGETLKKYAFYDEKRDKNLEGCKLFQLRTIIPPILKTIKDTLKDFRNKDKNGLSDLATLNASISDILLYYSFFAAITRKDKDESGFVIIKAIGFLLETTSKTENCLYKLQNIQKTTDEPTGTQDDHKNNDTTVLPNIDEGTVTQKDDDTTALIKSHEITAKIALTQNDGATALSNLNKTTDTTTGQDGDTTALPNPNEITIATTGTQNGGENLHENALTSTSTASQNKQDNIISQKPLVASEGVEEAVDSEQKAMKTVDEFSLKDSNRVQSDQNNQKFSSENTLLNVLDYFEQFLSTFSQQLTTSADTNSDIKKDTENYIDVCKAYRTIIEIYGLGYKIPSSLDETNLAIKNALTILTEYEKSENAKNLQTVETLNDLIHLFPARILALCTKNLNNDAFYNEIKENVETGIKLSQLKEIMSSTSKTIEDTLKYFKNEDKNGLSDLTTLNDNLLQLLLYHLFHGVLTENNGVISEFIDKKSVLFLVTTMIKTENYLSILQNNQKTTDGAIVTQNDDENNDSNALPNPNETIFATTGTQNDEAKLPNPHELIDETTQTQDDKNVDTTALPNPNTTTAENTKTQNGATLHENTPTSTSTANQNNDDSTISQNPSVASADIEAIDSQNKAIATSNKCSYTGLNQLKNSHVNQNFLSKNTLFVILDNFQNFLSTFSKQLTASSDTKSNPENDSNKYVEICNAYRTIIEKHGLDYKIPVSCDESDLKDPLTIIRNHEKSENARNVQNVKSFGDLMKKLSNRMIHNYVNEGNDGSFGDVIAKCKNNPVLKKAISKRFESTIKSIPKKFELCVGNKYHKYDLLIDISSLLYFFLKYCDLLAHKTEQNKNAIQWNEECVSIKALKFLAEKMIIVRNEVVKNSKNKESHNEGKEKRSKKQLSMKNKKIPSSKPIWR